jgi:hypothetical protein
LAAERQALAAERHAGEAKRVQEAEASDPHASESAAYTPPGGFKARNSNSINISNSNSSIGFPVDANIIVIVPHVDCT